MYKGGVDTRVKGLASIQKEYLYNNKLYNNYKKYNNNKEDKDTLLGFGSVSYQINDSLLDNGMISRSKHFKFEDCKNKEYDNFLVIRPKDVSKELKIVKSNRCGQPYCEYCRKLDGIRAEHRIKDVAKTFTYRKLLTLSFKNTREIGKKTIKKCVDQYKKVLKHLKIERYIRVVEIKSIGNGYNVHIHSIVDAKYIPVRTISAIFSKVSKGESNNVDIRGMSSNTWEYSSKYLSKYLIKYPQMQNLMEYVQFFSKLSKTRMLYTTEKLVKNSLKSAEFKALYDLIINCDRETVHNLMEVWCENYFKFIGVKVS